VRQVAVVRAGEWLAVFGCGGVGLSAVMIAAAAGARVIAIDTAPRALASATAAGAAYALPAGVGVAEQIRELSGGGVHVTVDALGAASITQAALAALRAHGRHVQVGLLPETVALDLGALVGRELQWLGSHGMSALDYPEMLALVAAGTLRPGDLVRDHIGLADVPAALAAMNHASPAGVTIIQPMLGS
jgi:alcohol dehydrogenase